MISALVLISLPATQGQRWKDRSSRCVPANVMGRFGMGLIREKLAVIQGSAIAMTMLVINLEKPLELLFV